MDKAIITICILTKNLKDDEYFLFIYNSIRKEVLKMQNIG